MKHTAPGLLLAATFSMSSPVEAATIMDSFYRSYFNGLCAGGDRSACGQAGDLNRDHAQRELLDEERQQTRELQQLRQELQQLRGLNRELGR